MSKMFNRICVMAVSILVAAFMCKASAAAREITVSGQNIQEALNAAKDSTEEIIVTIPSGTYYLNSSLLVYSNTTIRAEGAKIIVNNGQSALTVSPYIDPTNIKVSGGSWQADGAEKVIDFSLPKPGTDITLENVTVYGDKNNKGICLAAVTGGKVNRCVVENAAIGIDLSWCNEIAVCGNITRASAETGFQANKIENLTVSDNQFLVNGKYGFLADYIVSSVISKNTLNGCALDPNRAGHGEGLVVRYSEEVQVVGNEVYNVQSHVAHWGNGILIGASKDITVQGNTVDHAGNHGIQATYGSENVYINDNLVSNSGNIGISVSRATKADITGGVINNTTGSAIVYDGKPWNGMTGVYGTVTGCEIDGSTASGIFIEQAGVTVTGCEIDGSNAEGIHIERAEVTVKNATVKNSTGMGVVVLNGTATLSNNVILQDEVDAKGYGIVTNEGARVTLEGNRICNFGNSGIVINPGCIVTGTNNQIMVNANRFGSNSIYNPQGGSSEIKNNTLILLEISGTSVTGRTYWNDFECGAVVNGMKYETKVGAGGVSGNFTVSYPQTDSSRVVVYVRDDAGNATILQAPPNFDLNKMQSGDAQLVEDFVRRMYRTTLGREASAEEVKASVDRLQSGLTDGATMAQGFVGSPEFQGKNLSAEEYVRALYDTFFDRSAAPEEIQYWKDEMSSGMSRKFVLSGFVNSNEFEQLCQKAGITRGVMVLSEGEQYEINYEKLGEFVERLYVCALKRKVKPSEEEKQFWVTRIADRSMTAEDAAKYFFFSSEFEQQRTSNEEYIWRLYVTFMDREPVTAETSYWVVQIKDGMSRETVLAYFAASGEFKGIMARYGIR